MARCSRKKWSASAGRHGPQTVAHGTDRLPDQVRQGCRGERAVADRAQGPLEAEPEVGLLAGGRGDRPLEQDREVGGLLDLRHEDAGADGVDLSGGHQYAVPGPHLDPVHPRQHPLAVLGVDAAYQLVGSTSSVQPEVDRRARADAEDVPRLGLAVGAGQVAGREGPVRVDVHREPLPGVEQLEQQPRVTTNGGLRPPFAPDDEPPPGSAPRLPPDNEPPPTGGSAPRLPPDNEPSPDNEPPPDNDHHQRGRFPPSPPDNEASAAAGPAPSQPAGSAATRSRSSSPSTVRASPVSPSPKRLTVAAIHSSGCRSPAAGSPRRAAILAPPR